MKRLLILFTGIICLCSTACQNDEPKNNLYGTTWMAEDYWYGAFNGGSWYRVYKFKDNKVCDKYYQNTAGIIQERVENIKYSYKHPVVYIFSNNGDIQSELIINGTSMTPKGGGNYIFYKQ